MKLLKKNYSLYFNFILPVLGILLLVGVFFWKVFLQGLLPFPGDFVVGIYYPWLDYKWGYSVGVPVKNPIMADVPSFMYPMQTFAISQFKAGEWPLWNPMILAGTPLLANFQSAVFSPTNIFYFLTSDKNAWTLQIIIAHFLAAFFTFLLLKHWKLKNIAAVMGGTIFSFSGFNLIWSQWNGHVLVAAFFPLIILLLDKFFKKGGVLNLVLISLVLAMQIFSGYPQLILYTALVILILSLVYFRLTREYFLKIVLLATFIFLGFGLSAIQLLPGAELLSLSQWSAEPHPRLWAFLPLSKTITFIAPDFFGNHVTYNYWGPQDYTSNTGFVGIGALTLSLIAFKAIKKSREIKIALFIGVVALIFSYHTPISEFLWAKNVFGMQSSSAHRALVLFNLSMSLLAAFGLDLLIKNKNKLKLKRIILPLVILGFFALFALLEQKHQVIALRNLVFPLIVFLLSLLFIKKRLVYILFLLVVLELFRFGWKFTPFTKAEWIFPDTPVTKFLKDQKPPFRISNGDTMPVNFQMAYSLDTLGGYETMRPLLPSRFIATLNNKDANASPAGRYGIIDNDTSLLLNLVNTKYYLTLKRDEKRHPDPKGSIPTKFDSSRFITAFEDKSLVVMESKLVSPRAYMVYSWEEVASSSDALARLLDPEFDFTKRIVFEESVQVVPNSLEKKSEVSYQKYSPNELIISATTNSDGLLFVSDSYFPGWKAFVDGVETKILRANYAFRAVNVPEGKHTIKFLYYPESFSKGLTYTQVSLVLIVCISFIVIIGKTLKGRYT